jgi:hypothetical protein
LDIPHIDPRVQRELEAVADQFFDNGPQGALGLQAKCWAVWRGSAVWIRQASADMDSIYDTVLKKRTVDTRVDAAGRLIATRNLADEHYARRRKQAVVDRWATMTRLNALEREFVATRRNSAVRKALNTWRTRFLAACAQRWEASMNAREDELRRAFDNKRVQRAFDVSCVNAQETDGSTGTASHKSAKRTSTSSVQLCTRCLAPGHSGRRSPSSSSTSCGCGRSLRRRRQCAMPSAIGLYARQNNDSCGRRTHVSSPGRCRNGDTKCELSFRHWLTTLSQQRRLADTFNDARVLRGALGRIQTVLHKTQVRERQADAFAAERDGVLVRQCLRIWVAREHGQLLATALAKRRLRALFSHWRSRTAAVGTLESEFRDLFPMLIRIR